MKTLREWRLDRLMSIRRLAERSGVAPGTVLDIEHGRRSPSYDTMRKLSETLGVSAPEVAEFAATLEERGKDAA